MFTAKGLNLMFEKQKQVIEFLPEVKSIASAYGVNSEWIDPLIQHSIDFKVRFPLVGAFSSGKSSLLNALIGESIFATSIDPQTAIPAELSYSESEEFIAHYSDNAIKPISKESIHHNELSELQPDGWIEVKLPAEKLKLLPHVLLVDMPGWDSGIQGHARAIDQYATRSLAYGVVVSAEEGNLRESIRNALLELKVLDMPIIVIISKCDKKTPEEIIEVSAHIRKEIESAIDHSPLAVVCISSRKKNIDQFVQALQLLENEAEGLFHKKVVSDVLRQLAFLTHHLNTLFNKEDLNSEQIELKQQVLNRDISIFKQQLVDESDLLDQKVNSVVQKILAKVRSKLIDQLSTLTSQAMHGGDLSGTIGGAIRIAVADGIRADFLPEVKHYINKVDAVLPETFRINADISTMKNADYTEMQVTTVLGDIIDLITPFMTLGGRLTVIMPIINIVRQLFETLFSRQNKEVQEAERVENIRQQILNSVIPSALQQTEHALINLLNDEIAEVKEKVSQNIQSQCQQTEATLNELKLQLSKGQSEFQRQCEDYKRDLAKIETLITILEQ